MLAPWKESYDKPAAAASILKSRDTEKKKKKTRDSTLPTKGHIIKAMVFLTVMCGCESWTISLSTKELRLLN